MGGAGGGRAAHLNISGQNVLARSGAGGWRLLQPVWRLGGIGLHALANSGSASTRRRARRLGASDRQPSRLRGLGAAYRRWRQRRALYAAVFKPLRLGAAGVLETEDLCGASASGSREAWRRVAAITWRADDASVVLGGRRVRYEHFIHAGTASFSLFTISSSLPLRPRRVCCYNRAAAGCRSLLQVIYCRLVNAGPLYLILLGGRGTGRTAAYRTWRRAWFGAAIQGDRAPSRGRGHSLPLRSMVHKRP